MDKVIIKFYIDFVYDIFIIKHLVNLPQISYFFLFIRKITLDDNNLRK